MPILLFVFGFLCGAIFVWRFDPYRGPSAKGGKNGE